MLQRLCVCVCVCVCVCGVCVCLALFEVYFQGKFLEVESMGQQVNTDVVLYGITKSPSHSTIQMCLPTSNILGWPESSFGFFHNISWKNPSFLANPIKYMRVLFSPQSGQQENKRYCYIYIHFYIYLCRYVCVCVCVYIYIYINTQLIHN